MANENEAANASAQANAATGKKKLRRGIASVELSQLKFNEKDASPNGLFVGHLDGVSIAWSSSEDNKNFPNMRIPHLAFHFASNHAKADERRHVYLNLFPQPSSVDTIPNGKKAWQVDNVLRWIKHILEVYYFKGAEPTEADEDAFGLPFVDFDEKGEYVPIDIDDVVAGYTTLFNNVANTLNGVYNPNGQPTNTPLYLTKDGKFIPIWMKLLRYRKVNNEWRENGQNGDLAFDSFVGSGAIEPVRIKDKVALPPVHIRFDATRESITPKEVKKAPDTGIPAANAAALGMGAAVIPDSTGMPLGGGISDADLEANKSDMPF